MAKAPVVFINIGWMVEYAGISAADPTVGDFGFLKSSSIGHETWNFAPHRGRVYGYIPRSAGPNLEKLGGGRNDASMAGVTVVWIAKSPRDHKNYIVGWYKNATILGRSDDIVLKRKGGIEVGYKIYAASDDATLLTPPRRQFLIPTAKVKGNLGQSPVWYGGTDAFRDQVLDYVKAGGSFPKSKPSNKANRNRNLDPEARKKIELLAVKHATEFYESVAGGGHHVKSVEGDNVGWDLTVTAPTGAVLKVEVKGLSGSDVVVELTPNEYLKMQAREHRQDYVVYIVTQADARDARSHVFLHNKDLSKGRKLVWASADGRKLKIDRRVAARLSAGPALY